MNMTKKLYEEKPYLKECVAHVISCIQTNDLYDIILDQTCFFPEEGGQTCDQGTIEGIEVIDVQIKNDEIHHYTTQAIYGEVHLQIDWSHRYRNMQHHTGEHILSGLIHSNYHANNIGFHLGEHEVTADYDLSLSKEQIQTIEEKVNDVILENHPVLSYYLNHQDLEYRAKLDLENPRIIEILNIDLCACCAPHVLQTSEVNIFKIIKSERIKKGTRLYFVCGNDAYKDYTLKHDQTSQLTSLLKKQTNTLVCSVQNLLSEKTNLIQQNNQLLKELADYKYQNLDTTILFVEEMDRDIQLHIFKKMKPNSIIFSKQENGYRFMSTNATFFTLLKENFSTKAGGKNSFYQGSVQASQDQLEDLFHKEVN